MEPTAPDVQGRHLLMQAMLNVATHAWNSCDADALRINTLLDRWCFDGADSVVFLIIVGGRSGDRRAAERIKMWVCERVRERRGRTGTQVGGMLARMDMWARVRECTSGWET